ncbi:MAG TPA: hypothetical protein VFQ44_17295 [Streptosporangiaceae bacterium]|nr:hypothetical protein [Streptosporangiaceae bacterium]
MRLSKSGQVRQGWLPENAGTRIKAVSRYSYTVASASGRLALKYCQLLTAQVTQALAPVLPQLSLVEFINSARAGPLSANLTSSWKSASPRDCSGQPVSIHFLSPFI